MLISNVLLKGVSFRWKQAKHTFAVMLCVLNSAPTTHQFGKLSFSKDGRFFLRKKKQTWSGCSGFFFGRRAHP
jgi:hypothetical protein